MEEDFTEMTSPEAFAALSDPFSRQLTDEIRAAGMKSIYNYCGNPADRPEQIISVEPRTPMSNSRAAASRTKGGQRPWSGR